MSKMAVLLVLLCCVASLQASPVRTYDQRQQGELNIHAQLDNIVIVLVPTSNFDLFGLRGVNKFGQKPDKDEIIQFLQKPHKNDIDRYEIVKDENDNDIKEGTIEASQTVAIVQGDKNEKEEEVVATVEEMKPEVTPPASGCCVPKAADPPKSEATEETPVKEHSTVSETVQDVMFKVSVPVELKDKIKPEEAKPIEPVKEPEVNKPPKIEETTSEKKEEVKKEVMKEEPVKKEESEKKDSPKEEKPSPEPTKKLTIEDFVKPVAEKEKNSSEEKIPATSKTPEDSVKKTLVEGARREKVIRYKPESKWAPGLVDILAAPRTKVSAKEAEERQRFAALCAPGSWDSELKTCIMPGETRSRHELARFLEAMRFGIAIPSANKQRSSEAVKQRSSEAAKPPQNELTPVPDPQCLL